MITTKREKFNFGSGHLVRVYVRVWSVVMVLGRKLHACFVLEKEQI